MCRNSSLHDELNRCGALDILASLAELRVFIGNKENNPGSSSFALTQLANSASIGKIIDSLEHILNLKGGPGYSFGTVVLPAILQFRSSLIWSNLTAKRVNPFAGAVKTEL